jgi:steroid delta-isomerase-like uncharacterized protein
MSPEENKALTRRFYEEIYNQRHLAVIEELTAPEAFSHEAPPGTAEGPEGVRQVLQMLASAFPNLQMTIEDLIAEGDKVAARTTFSGTHLGVFLGIPPTGKSFTQRQIHILRFTDGKLAEHWAVRDDLGTMQQLGVIPAPGR